jgi:hypothetical protein
MPTTKHPHQVTLVGSIDAIAERAALDGRIG